MQDIAIPAKFPIPFANSAASANIRAIPKASQIGVQNGAASLTDGFPPNCFIPIAGGGSWPFGQDFNGLMNQVTLWQQWQQAGAPIGYDAAFSAAIGGYPRGSVIASATLGGAWLSTVDNNVTDPDTGGAGWISYLSGRLISRQVINATSSVTAPAGATGFFAQIWAGGGGSGGTSGSSSGSLGGGGGEYAEGMFTCTQGQVIPATIGTGGAAGLLVGGSVTNGQPGGASSFGTFINCGGGGGGTGAVGGLAGGDTAGGSGGTGGDFRSSGGNASGPFLLSNGIVFASIGGGSTQGGQPVFSGAQSPPAGGNNGFAPGGGASGSLNGASGALGASGRIIIWWFS